MTWWQQRRKRQLLCLYGAVWPALGGSFWPFKYEKQDKSSTCNRGFCDPVSECKLDFPPSQEARGYHLSHSLVAEDLDLHSLPRKMAITYHPLSMQHSLRKRLSAKGFVRRSAFCSVLRQYEIWIAPHLTWEQKWWYLSVMCFVRGVNFRDVSIIIHD